MPATTDLFAKCPVLKLNPLPREVVVLEPDPSVHRLVEELALKAREHYATEKILEKWGRTKTARFLINKIPISKRGQSGDLGEILATEFVNSGSMGYEVPINRLRWKDSRELPMRGDDLIGFKFTSQPIQFLKAEAKSRKQLTATVVAAARAALNKNSGLPLPHTLAFIIERLFEADHDDKANLIEEYVDNRLPTRSQVAHLIFTFSGNDPSTLLMTDVGKLKGRATYHSIGLRVDDHQEFIAAVFKEMING